MAVSRSGASLETNPVDVHRATEAVLAGVDHVARTCPKVTFVATTNHPAGVDVAFMSRADLVEEMGYPDGPAIHAILLDTLRELTDRPLDGAALPTSPAAARPRRIDARQVRKLVLRAVCNRRELALDPSDDRGRRPRGDLATPSATASSRPPDVRARSPAEPSRRRRPSPATRSSSGVAVVRASSPRRTS